MAESAALEARSKHPSGVRQHLASSSVHRCVLESYVIFKLVACEPNLSCHVVCRSFRPVSSALPGCLAGSGVKLARHVFLFVMGAATPFLNHACLSVVGNTFRENKKQAPCQLRCYTDTRGDHKHRIRITDSQFSPMADL